jgi:dolichyl-phosphate-mannose-protein mannosyltransferase
MAFAPIRDEDPQPWCILIALAFVALALVQLAIPGHPYFDETHYVPAARSLLNLSPDNREHPMFAKEVIAAAIAVLGDRPMAWRLPAVLFGAFGLYALGRLVWQVSGRRVATLLAIVLLASNFMWFVLSRVAMLDIFAASLAIAGLWQFAAALDSAHPRWRLALAGLVMGLALASKWSVAPLAMLAGLAFLAFKLARSDRPLIKRIALAEAALWLGALPLTVYWLTFLPAMFYPANVGPVAPLGFVAEHRAMLALQQSVTEAHNYQSVWWQWLANLRPIWFLYEHADGAQRGIVLLGNPLTMLLGLPAMVWCVWAAWARSRIDAAAMVLGFAASLALWLVPGKPVQFYYHYLLPSVFLMGALALALDEDWRRGGVWRLVSLAVPAASLALFAWFYPILAGAPLAGPMGFEQWMWLDSWR